jgi:hypothetical protein
MTDAPRTPTALPTTTPGQILGRLALVALLSGTMIGASVGARHLRDAVIHEPVCTRVCGTRGQRYEGVTQHRKSDAAAACVCVGPGRDRAEVPTRFFSDFGPVDFIARELTSTMGVVFSLLLIGTAVAVVVMLATRRRASPAPT